MSKYYLDTTTGGGPAFPNNAHGEGIYNEHPGLTMRDYFAAAALQGLCASPDPLVMQLEAADLCKMAYSRADAMLVERSK